MTAILLSSEIKKSHAYSEILQNLNGVSKFAETVPHYSSSISPIGYTLWDPSYACEEVTQITMPVLR